MRWKDGAAEEHRMHRTDKNKPNVQAQMYQLSVTLIRTSCFTAECTHCISWHTDKNKLRKNSPIYSDSSASQIGVGSAFK